MCVGYRGACHIVWRIQECMSHVCGGTAARVTCVWGMWDVCCMWGGAGVHATCVWGFRGACHIFVGVRSACHMCGGYKSAFHMWLRGVGVHATCMYVGVQGCMPPVCRGTAVQAI